MGGGGTEETPGPEVPPNPTQSPQKPNGWTAGSARGQQLAQGAELGQRQPSRPAVLFMLVLLPGFSSSAGRWETDGKCFFIIIIIIILPFSLHFLSVPLCNACTAPRAEKLFGGLHVPIRTALRGLQQSRTTPTPAAVGLLTCSHPGCFPIAHERSSRLTSRALDGTAVPRKQPVPRRGGRRVLKPHNQFARGSLWMRCGRANTTPSSCRARSCPPHTHHGALRCWMAMRASSRSSPLQARRCFASATACRGSAELRPAALSNGSPKVEERNSTPLLRASKAEQRTAPGCVAPHRCSAARA